MSNPAHERAPVRAVARIPAQRAPVDPPSGRHATTGPTDPRRDAGLSPRSRPMVRRWALWLLVVPLVVPLLSPLYNRRDPTLWGVPFFFWFQIACAFLACATITAVYQLTKGRR